MITLIGKNLANKGLKFMHYGASSQCERCRFKGTCIDSLESGRMYIIKDVKDAEQPCFVHEGGKVKVVDVERAYIKTAVDSKKAFEGSKLVFNPPECDEECSMRDLCFPEGLYREDKCKIVKKVGKIKDKCAKGYDLTTVLLKY
ncbi:UPF0179 family protein [Methanobacterium congolense]|jgi:hypothetical protein|uniref:UPF0179 protein MCBB_1175 n=1 Tax=Methanobacterium congolense TaxID=118062 RepID=A0A1D3L2F8_9EURY|nr:UPF0179 family protein [Methanobacterium congolense]SCG85733.1 UPF0179 protein [Methanobacterium congolense]